MLDASDALRAHAHCRIRLADNLRARCNHHTVYHALFPDSACPMVRFILENDATPGLEPELALLRAAHATVHRIAIGLAQKQTQGKAIDLKTEFAPHSNFGAASSSLVAAVWRLENKLHPLAA